MNIGETFAKIANEGEPPLISQLSRAIWAVGVAQAAIRLELFTELHGKKLTSKSVANLLGSNYHYTKLLLNACVSIALLEKVGDEYRNSEESDIYLVKGEPRYYGDLFTYWTEQWPLWDQLDSGVRTGTPLAYEPEFESIEEEAAYWRHYMMAMHQWGTSGQQDLLLQSTDLTGKKKLLDVAGGSGVYTMALCRKYPELEAVIFESGKGPAGCQVPHRDSRVVPANLTGGRRFSYRFLRHGIRCRAGLGGSKSGVSGGMPTRVQKVP